MSHGAFDYAEAASIDGFGREIVATVRQRETIGDEPFVARLGGQDQCPGDGLPFRNGASNRHGDAFATADRDAVRAFVVARAAGIWASDVTAARAAVAAASASPRVARREWIR